MKELVMFSLHTPDIDSYGRYSRRNKEEYCRQHGISLEYYDRKIDDRPAAWSKIRVMADTNFQWGMWIDADAWIMNKKFNARELIDENFEFIMSKREGSLNMGVFLMKGSDYAYTILEKIDMMDKFYDHTWWEQAAFIDLYNKDAELRSKIKFIDCNILNCPQDDVTENTFIAHHAGTTKEHRNKVFKTLPI